MIRKIYRWLKKTMLKAFKVKIPPNTEPLVVSDTVLLGQPMKLLTHRQDKVLSAMLRGEQTLCPHYQAELAWLKEQIRLGDFVLDAGGNIGSVSIALALSQPQATIVAFEPDPLNFGLFQANLVLNHCENVRAFNMALGKDEGLIEFYRSPDNFGDHRSSKPKGIDLRESEFRSLPSPVLKTRASSFLTRSFPGKELDLVKIDTQGADFEILSDILPLLKSTAKVAIEYSPYHLDANGTKCDQVVELLKAFRALYIIQPDAGSYLLEPTDIQTLKHFYAIQHERYKTHYDLVLCK